MGIHGQRRIFNPRPHNGRALIDIPRHHVDSRGPLLNTSPLRYHLDSIAVRSVLNVSS